MSIEPADDLRHDAARRRAGARVSRCASTRSSSWPGSSPRSAWTSSRPVSRSPRRPTPKRCAMIATHIRGPVIAGAGALHRRRHRPRRRGRSRRRRAAASTCSSPPPICTSSASCGCRASLPRRGGRRRPPRPDVHRRRAVLGGGCDAQRSGLPLPRRRSGHLSRLQRRSTCPTRSATRRPTRCSEFFRRADRRACRTPTRRPSARTATTTSASPSRTRWRASPPARGRSSARSTASASAPATPRSKKSSWRRASGPTACRSRPAIDAREIFPSSQLLTALTGESVQANKAIVGRNAFAHEAGIHQDGMLKDRRTYEIMRPEEVGVPQATLVLGKHSGRHAVQRRCEQLGLTLERHELDQVYRAVMALADREKIVNDPDLAEDRHRDAARQRQPDNAAVRGSAGRRRLRQARRLKNGLPGTASESINPSAAGRRHRSRSRRRRGTCACAPSRPLLGHEFDLHDPADWRRGALGAAWRRCRQRRSPRRERPTRSCSARSAIRRSTRGLPAGGPRPRCCRSAASCGLYANLRPARVWPGLEAAGPLKPEVLAGTDLLVVRELTGGLYYGEPRGYRTDGDSAHNTMRYSRARNRAHRAPRVRRPRACAASASRRSTRPTCSRRRACGGKSSPSVGAEYPDVTLDHMLVDTCAMKLALRHQAST